MIFREDLKMKRLIMVEWTCSEQIEVEIADGALTDEQIEDAADKAARHILPGDGNDCDNWEWGWLGKAPKSKEDVDDSDGDLDESDSN
jgi:hypothetical protein